MVQESLWAEIQSRKGSSSMGSDVNRAYASVSQEGAIGLGQSASATDGSWDAVFLKAEGRIEKGMLVAFGDDFLAAPATAADIGKKLAVALSDTSLEDASGVDKGNTTLSDSSNPLYFYAQTGGFADVQVREAVAASQNLYLGPASTVSPYPNGKVHDNNPSIANSKQIKGLVSLSAAVAPTAYAAGPPVVARKLHS